MEKVLKEDSTMMLQRLKLYRAAAWMIVRKFCSAEGYVVVPKNSEQAQVFPPDDYKLIAYWLHSPLGQHLFSMKDVALSSIVKDLSDYVGWIVETTQLRTALYRYNAENKG